MPLGAGMAGRAALTVVVEFLPEQGGGYPKALLSFYESTMWGLGW